MTPPSSAARALHDLLDQVGGRIGNADKSAWHAWGAVANAQVMTAEFARFNAEVMALFQSVAEDVQSLTEIQQERYSVYLPQWWDALVRPRHDWVEGGRGITESAPLHMLAGLADLLESRTELLGERRPQTVEILARAVKHLQGEVERLTDLPKSVRAQILADLDHIAWLLSHADWFGVDHAVEAMERTAGRVVVEATKTRSTSLKCVGVGLFAALTFVSGVTGSVAQIADDVRSTFGIEAEADAGKDPVMQVLNVCQVEVKQVTSVPDGEPIDAEIVEDEPTP